MKFKNRHIGITKESKEAMLSTIGYSSIENLCIDTLAKDISYTIDTFPEMSEQSFEQHIKHSHIIRKRENV